MNLWRDDVEIGEGKKVHSINIKALKLRVFNQT